MIKSFIQAKINLFSYAAFVYSIRMTISIAPSYETVHYIAQSILSIFAHLVTASILSMLDTHREVEILRNKISNSHIWLFIYISVSHLSGQIRSKNIIPLPLQNYVVHLNKPLIKSLTK